MASTEDCSCAVPCPSRVPREGGRPYDHCGACARKLPERLRPSAAELDLRGRAERARTREDLLRELGEPLEVNDRDALRRGQEALAAYLPEGTSPAERARFLAMQTAARVTRWSSGRQLVVASEQDDGTIRVTVFWMRPES